MIKYVDISVFQGTQWGTYAYRVGDYNNDYGDLKSIRVSRVNDKESGAFEVRIEFHRNDEIVFLNHPNCLITNYLSDGSEELFHTY